MPERIKVALDTEQKPQRCNRQADQAYGGQVPGPCRKFIEFFLYRCGTAWHEILKTKRSTCSASSANSGKKANPSKLQSSRHQG